MKSSNGVSLMLRFSALTMPEVTVPPRPSGLPMASTASPGFTRSLLPKLTAGSGLDGSIFSSAMSMRFSAAIRRARSWRLSSITTVMA